MKTTSNVKTRIKHAVHYSSASVEWATPQWLFDLLDDEFKFTLDPCATKANAKCKKYFTREQDGLKQSWEDERVFVNPPYGEENAKWIMKAALLHQSKAELTVCLVPARTDTRWWALFVEAWATEIRLVTKRLKFGDGNNSAPFPSVVVIYKKGALYQQVWGQRIQPSPTPTEIKAAEKWSGGVTRWLRVEGGFVPLRSGEA